MIDPVLGIGGLQPLQLPLEHRGLVLAAVLLLHLQHRVFLDLVFNVLQKLLGAHLQDLHRLHHLR